MAAIIYSHCDFDGAASAALISYFEKIDDFRFATPDNIFLQPVSGEDIVCDLPYVSGCGMWFDHHATNIQEIRDRGLNPDNLAGANSISPSATQVIFDHYFKKTAIPKYFNELVQAANKIDTMNYSSLQEWLKDSPDNMLNETININSESFPAMNHQLVWLTRQLREKSVSQVADDPRIINRYKQKLNSRQKEFDFIRKVAFYLPEDKSQRIIILDCSELAFSPKFNKSLALAIHPQVQYILLIASDFNYGRRTNNLKISLAKNFLDPSDKKLGVFLEELQIGGGHDNAAGGLIRANSKKERLMKLKDFEIKLLDFIK